MRKKSSRVQQKPTISEMDARSPDDEILPEEIDHESEGGDLEAAAAEELEAGIASVFERIRSGEPFEPADEDDDLRPEDTTIALLAELNRIWASPRP